VPRDHVFFGSDYPFLSATEAVHKFDQLKTIDATTRAAIERNNALKLFPRLKALKI
jgi:predicted TIM-barrel fold metal-dependent hydrolase